MPDSGMPELQVEWMIYCWKLGKCYCDFSGGCDLPYRKKTPPRFLVHRLCYVIQYYCNVLPRRLPVSKLLTGSDNFILSVTLSTKLKLKKTARDLLELVWLPSGTCIFLGCYAQSVCSIISHCESVRRKESAS